MTYVPMPVETFGGLDLTSDSLDVGAGKAVAMNNLDIRPGYLATRPGVSNVTAAQAIAPESLVYFDGFIVARTNTTVTTPFNVSTGTAGTTVAAAPQHPNSWAVFDGRLYLSDGAALRYFNGTAWTTVGGVTGGGIIAITPWDTRMIGGQIGSPTVSFSKAGDPTTWDASDFQDIDHDGSGVTGIVSWRDYSFVFSGDRFFVFYGTDIDTDGGAIFNYRAVRSGHGIFLPGSACAGEEGVYFADGTGVYVTSGDTPTCVSRSLEGAIRAGTIFLDGAKLSYFNRRLYVATISGSAYVYDPQIDTWVQWDAFPQFASGGVAVPGVLYSVDTAAKKIIKFGTTPGAVTWSYTSGQYDLSIPDRKVIRETEVWGNGTTTLQMAVDAGSFDTGGTVAPASLASAVQRIARRGTYFQHKFSGTGAMTLNSMVHRVRDQEDPR